MPERADVAATNPRDVSLAEAAMLCAESSSVLVLTHRNPDGDAVGSATALADALRASGHAVRIVCPDTLPPYLLSVPGADSIQQDIGEGPWDLVIAVDVSDPALLQPLPSATSDFFLHHRSLNLDHHFSNLKYAQFNHVDPAAASATEIVGKLVVSHLGTSLTVDLATDLLYGVVNDTHSFQNSNTTASTLRFSADLVDAGADLSRVAFNLLLEKESASARLWAQVLPSLEFADGERVATLTVTTEALARAGASMTGADGLVEFLRNIRGVDMAVLYKQTGPDTFRLSMRTSAAVDATRVAAIFGGGGHQRAAGGEAHGTQAQVHRRLIEAYEQTRARPED